MGAEIAPERFAGGMERQLRALEGALAQGMPRRGWKVGINVPEVRERLGLPHAAVGWLEGRRVLASGARLEAPAGSRLHAEPELALRIGTSLHGLASVDACRSAIAAVHPALEIVDYALPTGGLADLIAHSMFHHASVLGAPGSLGAESGLGTLWPTLSVGGRRVEGARPDLVPDDLGQVVRHAAAYLAAFGRSLEAGDLLLSGAYLAAAVPVSLGAEVVAHFGALGSVAVRITGSESG
jgi:2-keto-4-pentenoate hydratase